LFSIKDQIILEAGEPEICSNSFLTLPLRKMPPRSRLNFTR
jgi:hypothetical protein